MATKRKRCPNGSRKNKEGNCISYKKPSSRKNVRTNGLPRLNINLKAKKSKSKKLRAQEAEAEWDDNWEPDIYLKKLRAKRAVNKLLGYPPDHVPKPISRTVEAEAEWDDNWRPDIYLKKKRCPRGSRKNKKGVCIKY